jgi:hypothetical protein
MTNVTFITPNDTLEIIGSPTSSTGYFLAAMGLRDWYAGAESKTPANQRPQAAGAFGISNDWASSLAISVKGSFDGATLADAITAAERLSAVAAGVPVQMVVEDPLRTTSRWVSVRQVTLPTDVGVFASLDFSIDVLATDPLRYGDPLSVTTGIPVSGGGLLWPLGTTALEYWDWGDDGTSGRVSITNAGTADVWPTISALGGLGEGFVATNVTTGETIRFVRPIPEGSTVAINQRTGSASIDGQSDVGGFITERGFFTIPAGATHQIQFAGLGAVTGTPQFTAALSPGYL